MAGTASGAVALAAPAVGQGGKSLRIARFDTTAYVADTADRLAAAIAAATGGAMQLGFETGFDADAALDAVAAGEIDGYLGEDHAFIDRDPAFGLFAGCPFGLTSREFEAWYHFGGGADLWDALGDLHGIKPLLAGDRGAKAMGWFTAAPRGLDAFQNLSMRARGLATVAVQALGGRAVRGDGAADASQSDGLAEDMASGFHERFRVLAVPAGLRSHSALTLAFNAGVWRGLPDADKALLSTVASAEVDATAAAALASDAAAFNTLLSEGRVAPVPDGLFGEMAKRVTEALSDTLASRSLVPGTADAYDAFLRDVGTWTKISDSAYAIARATALGLDT